MSDSNCGLDAPPPLSIVVPTRNERASVGPLLRRVSEVLPDADTEVIFVDDSDDGTPEVIAELGRGFPGNVTLVHRPPAGREGGLGGAVVEGIARTQARWVCVMDADLQHPLEVIPQMLRHARERELDLVIAGRYCERGGTGAFGPLRSALSRLSTTVTRACFPVRLGAVSDPMSGFFLVRRDAVDPRALRPRGFKILLEVLVRGRAPRVGEVGYRFGRRQSGTSKASLREAARFALHLLRLRVGTLLRDDRAPASPAR